MTQRKFKRRFNALRHVVMDPASTEEAKGEAARLLVQLGEEMMRELPNDKNRVKMRQEPLGPARTS